MTTFPCAACGAAVTVAVRRNHRYCADCRAAAEAAKKQDYLARRERMKTALRGEMGAAARMVEAILGVESSSLTLRCVGCGDIMPPRRGRGGPPRKWCSEACRQRVGVRGQAQGAGFVGALIRDPCAYCGGPGGEIDHIEPGSRGGANGAENLTGACVTCNTRKSTMPLLKFLLAAPLYERMEATKVELRTLAEVA